MDEQQQPIKKVNGRRAIIQALDAMLEKAGNIQKFQDDCQTIFDNGPLLFVKQFIYPLIPPSMLEEKEDDTKPFTIQIIPYDEEKAHELGFKHDTPNPDKPEDEPE